MSFSKTLFAAVVLISVLVSGCKSSHVNSASDTDTFNYKTLVQLIESGEFEIENQLMFPAQQGQIDLTTNPNHIRFYGDSISIHLPYYGVRTSGSANAHQGGIKYEGLMDNLNIEKSEPGRTIQLSFDCKPRGEHLSFDITLYTNKKALTDVKLSNRHDISYQGYISEIE